ncbi:SIS domain-containing protein [Bosea caraganae]|uniref:Glutamine--fructose-6-phosphate aminotransferase [isomerizing] n=1 Tax=Bosea caraganae TaxID=2763117 RepID=A0A370KYC0_9HYPH|nr:SIS domain-containing protein [Bosea caraganae]RDJ19978.1 SIS domain-containing protein [Bosea caraganae]RDJ23917.1 SIS domain-containing protein [Bosea caraganae]
MSAIEPNALARAPVDESIIDGFIRAQAQAVPATISSVREQLGGLDLRPAKHLVLVGSGTSLNALLVAKPGFEAGGAFVEVLNPVAFLSREPALGRDALVIALSQTGTSETTVAAVRQAQESGWRCLTITAEAHSPIGQVAASKLVLPVGPEPVGPKTKGYTASLAGLFELAAAFGGKAGAAEIDEDLLAAVIAKTTPPAFALAAELDEADGLLFTGEGRHHGTALEASLKIAEMTGVPAAAFPTEEAMHGRFHGLTAKSLCVMIAADEAERALAAHAAGVMAGLGVRTLILNLTSVPTPHDWVRTPALSAPHDTIAAIIPVQRLAQAMAARRGIPPHLMRFPGLSKLLGIKIDRLT